MQKANEYPPFAFIIFTHLISDCIETTEHRSFTYIEIRYFVETNSFKRKEISHRTNYVN